MSARTQVAIIGAGPYGLAAAAHLRAAGIETRVFGKAMSFWRQQMPAGMLLISSWDASHIADPRHALTLDAYMAERQLELPRPIPLEGFTEYGKWFQRKVVPDLDERTVTCVEPASPGFGLVLEDGERIEAERVVLASGLAPFAARPAVFDGISPALASHTADHHDLGRFTGRRVVVIGAGQSAFTSAALLHESGAEVEVIVREPQIFWVQRKFHRHALLKPLARLAYASSDVGPAGLSRLIGMPELFRRLPTRLRRRISVRSTRPSGAPWLRPRVRDVPFTLGRAVTAAEPVRGRLRLRLNDGTEREVDHALLATGYRVAVARYPFLSEPLVRAVRQEEGFPVLGAGFESSVPGLHFIGAVSEGAFGPLVRFVAGTDYTGRALARAISASKPEASRAGYAQGLPAPSGSRG
jgi:cation diffusion facilitator CzcD-associated flavoprotein CzcO